METPSFQSRFECLWANWRPTGSATNFSSDHARDKAFAAALQAALSEANISRACSYKTVSNWRKGNTPPGHNEMLPVILKVALNREPDDTEIAELASSLPSPPASQRGQPPHATTTPHYNWSWVQDYQRNPTNGLAHMTLHVPASPNNEDGTVPFRISVAFGSASDRIDGESYSFRLRRAFVVEVNTGMERHGTCQRR